MQTRSRLSYRIAASPSPVQSVDLHDAELLARYQRGDQSAASEIYERYVHRLRSLVRVKSSCQLGKRVDADDIVQVVFYRFFQHVQAGDYLLQAGEALWPLLVVITLNKLRSEETFHRAAKRDIRLDETPDDSSDELLGRLASKRESSAEFDLCMHEALAALPTVHQQVIQLRMEGYEVNEIADKLSRPKRSVERLLHESREMLHASLT